MHPGETGIDDLLDGLLQLRAILPGEGEGHGCAPLDLWWWDAIERTEGAVLLARRVGPPEGISPSGDPALADRAVAKSCGDVDGSRPGAWLSGVVGQGRAHAGR
ncbi:hypothetical protein GCM10009753_69150 [Streptantibioticus ferralitis]